MLQLHNHDLDICRYLCLSSPSPAIMRTTHAVSTVSNMRVTRSRAMRTVRLCAYASAGKAMHPPPLTMPLPLHTPHASKAPVQQRPFTSSTEPVAQQRPVAASIGPVQQVPLVSTNICTAHSIQYVKRIEVRSLHEHPSLPPPRPPHPPVVSMSSVIPCSKHKEARLCYKGAYVRCLRSRLRRQRDHYC